ncbi:MAG TPA: protein kinase [Allosphingosinicella sp.]|jgi:serine/threonine protein kinase
MNKRPTISVDNGVAIIDGKSIPLRNIVIDRPIESGAHGSVFAATETVLGRTVAVKVWYRVGEQVRDGAIGEVRKLASIAHPLFVTVYQLDIAADAPYSVMEFIPGPSVKKWLSMHDLRRPGEVSLWDHIRQKRENIWQRCKFWSLYSAGLKYLYSQDMLHGDPHLGNVMASRDAVGASNQLLDHNVPKASDLLSIRMLDLGTSLFRIDPMKIRARESSIIFESAVRLFPDFDPREVMEIDSKLEPEVMLRVLDKFVEYVLEITSVPGMTKTDFDFLSHGLPQLLGWCPFFNYGSVGEHLSSLLPEDADELISDTLWHMRSKNVDLSAGGDVQRVRQRKSSISQDVRDLVELSRRFRTRDWEFD